MTEIDSTTLRIIGEDLHPSNFDVRDLSEVLEGIEDLVRGMNPELSSEAKICLEHISEGSVKLRMVSTVVGLLTSTMPVIAQAIDSGTTSSLPIAARSSLVNLKGIAKKRHIQIQLTGEGLAPIYISENTEVELPKPIRGPSEFVAKVYRAGGKSPRGMFEGPRGAYLFLDLTEEQAIVCGKNLYARMKLTGSGVWDAETCELIDFKPDAVSPIVERDRSAAIERLGAIFSGIDPSMLEEVRRVGGAV